MRNSVENRFIKESSLIVAMVKGLIFGVVSVLVLSFIPALVISSSIMSALNIGFSSTVVLFLGSAMSAYIAASSYGKNGMFLGIAIGLSLLGIIVLLGLSFQVVSFEIVNLSLFFIKCFGLMLFGAIGGILGINISR